MRLINKWSLVLLLIFFASLGLAAVELDYHAGVGISVPFVETQATFAFPSLYGGLGANLTPSMALGAEYEVFGFYLLGYGALVHLPKVYVKYDRSPRFTLSGVGGYAFPTVFTPDKAETITEANVGFAGFKATLFFMYAEYLFQINGDSPVSLLSLGVAIKR